VDFINFPHHFKGVAAEFSQEREGGKVEGWSPDQPVSAGLVVFGSLPDKSVLTLQEIIIFLFAIY